jgi:RNA polymerase sigma-70 factor, ECF subfamily
MTASQRSGWRRVRLRSWHARRIEELLDTLDALMKRVQHGDRVAFAGVYDAVSPRVFGVVKRVLRDPAMSEEVTQEVFVELWQKAATYDAAQASVSTWATTIARRRAIDRVRREQSQRSRVEALGRLRDESTIDPADQVAGSLDSERLIAALGLLPNDQREVIQLAFIDGRPHGAIADQLGLPLGTVKGRVRGGLKRLRSIIGEVP